MNVQVVNGCIKNWYETIEGDSPVGGTKRGPRKAVSERPFRGPGWNGRRFWRTYGDAIWR